MNDYVTHEEFSELMQDLLSGFDQRRDAGIENDRGNDHRAQIFDASVTERMLLVRRAVRQTGADDRDYRRERIGQVVDRVQCHGDRMRYQTDPCLHGCQEYIAKDPDQTCAYDDPIPQSGFARQIHGRMVAFLFFGFFLYFFHFPVL